MNFGTRWSALLALTALATVGCASRSDGGDAGSDADDAVLADAVTNDGDDATPDSGPAMCTPASASGPDIVVTEQGTLRGVVAGAVRSFRGIRYAAPPRGDLRWRPPAPAPCIDGVRDANSFGEVCPQTSATTGGVIGSEDCLTLNVWTPSATPTAPLPVMFFIHGGGNYQGSSSQTLLNGAPLYDGAYLAEHGNAIVVTINYRLGALGFLAHSALTAESPEHASGNYGLLDQIAALHWVQSNIAAFGGDPARVMVFGESAGGLDTCALLASPLSTGLFSRALIESGGCIASPLAEVEMGGTMFATNAGCDGMPDTLACMRGLSAEDAIRALPGSAGVSLQATGYAYHLAVDGHVLTEAPSAALAAGRQHAMPVIMGTNRDEYSLFFPPTGGNGAMTDAEYQMLVTTQFMGAAPSVLMLYPSSAFPSPYFAYVDIFSDAIFTCPARRAARSLGGTMTEPVRRYFFTHSEPGALAAPYGAAHAFELTYVFHNFGVVPNADQLALSDAMVGYWSRFAATGDPNGGTAPAWPVNTPTMDAYLQLDSMITAGNGVNTARCNAWDLAAHE